MEPIIRDGVSLLVSDSDKQFVFVQRLLFILCVQVGVWSQTCTAETLRQQENECQFEELF